MHQMFLGTLNVAKNSKKIGKRAIKTISIVFALYVLLYVLNSAFGGYWMVPERDGRVRYKNEFGGLSMSVAVLWQPYFGHNALGQTDFLGALFAPLIALDRYWVHPTHYTIDENFDAWIKNLHVSNVHPRWRDGFLTQVTASASRDEKADIVQCVLRLTGSKHPRKLTEVRVPRDLVSSLQASPPSNFTEVPFENSLAFRNERTVRWIGELPMLPDQDVVITIPSKRPMAGAGKIVLRYEYSDNRDTSFQICTVELSPEK